MNIILSLTLVLLFHRIHADASYDDLNGSFTLVPKWKGWEFCSRKLQIEANGNIITKMVFNENETVCSTENLYFKKKSDSSQHQKAKEGVYLLSTNRTVCDGFSVMMKMRNTLQPYSRDPLGGPTGDRITLTPKLAYLSIFIPKDTSCIYKSDMPASSPSPVPSLSPLPVPKKPQAPAPTKKTSKPVWVWLGPVIGAILAVILAGICLALVKDRLCFGPKPVWHTPFFQRS